MAGKGLSQLSGKVRVRAFTRLDSDRTTFLSLDQAEPNLGLPSDSGGILLSTADGTRFFSKSIDLDQLDFGAGTLDSVIGGNERHVLAITNPANENTVGIISVRELLGDSGLGVDTLQSVTNRGDSTDKSITIFGLSLTRADSVDSGTAILVRNLETDSVGIRSFGSLADEAGLLSDGDVASLSGLSLTAIDSDPDTQTVLVINEITDSVGKRSFASLASDAGLVSQGDAISAGGLQLTVADSDPTTDQVLVKNPLTDSVGIRSFASLSDASQDTLQTVVARGDSTSLAIKIGGLILSQADSDATTTELLVRNLLTDSVGVRSFTSLAEEAGLLQDGDAASLSGLTLTAVDSDPTSTTILVLDETTDSVQKRSFQSLADDAGLVSQGDAITAGGLSITTVDSDSDTDQVLVLNLLTDSVGIRKFGDLADDAGLIAQGDDISAGGLTISQVDSDPDTTILLVLDETTDSVGKRSFQSLAEEAGLVSQGDQIQAGGLSITQTDSDSDTNQVLVKNLETDSVGIRSFQDLAEDAGLISQGDRIVAGGLSITVVDSDSDTDQVLVLNLDTDSVGIRKFGDLADDAGLIAQGDDISTGGLTISQVDSDSDTNVILVLNELTDSVGKRTFVSLANEAGIGADTLQIVTDRGDSTTRGITIGGLVLTRADSDTTTSQLLVRNLLTDSVGIRTFADLTDEAGLGNDTLQSVTDRGDSTDNTLTLKSGLITENLPTNNDTTTVLVLTASDSVAQRTFASLAATEVDNLQDVTDRGDSTNNDILIRDASLTADSVSAQIGFFDRRGNALIIYDSSGAILWGA